MRILSNVAISGNLNLGSSNKKDTFVIGTPDLENNNVNTDVFTVWANADFRNNVQLGANSDDFITISGTLSASNGSIHTLSSSIISSSNLYLDEFIFAANTIQGGVIEATEGLYVNGTAQISQSLTVLGNIYLSGNLIGFATGSGGGSIISVDKVVYVAKTGTQYGSGTLAAPFNNIQSAIDFASSSYPTHSEPVFIYVLPGLYEEDVTVTRKNLYIKSFANKAESKLVTFKGKTTINIPNATQKYNEIVAFEGIFFHGKADTADAALYLSSGSYATYVKDCYLYTLNASNASVLRATGSFSSKKIILQNCIFNASGSSGVNQPIIDLRGCNTKIDTLELYSETGGTGNGINVNSDGIVSVDRAIIAPSTTGYPVYNASTRTPTLSSPYSLLLTNSSVGSANGTSIYCANYTFLWNVLLANATPKVSGPSALVNVYYSQLTAGSKITWDTITPVALHEEFGRVTAETISIKSNLIISSGSNKPTGTATLNAGNPASVVVTNSLVTTSSIIFLTKQTNNHSANGNMAIVKSNGSFTITSNHNGDTDVVGYMIVNN